MLYPGSYESCVPVVEPPPMLLLPQCLTVVVVPPVLPLVSGELEVAMAERNQHLSARPREKRTGNIFKGT